MTKRAALADRCSNPGFYNRWTCPGCYNDLPDKKEGTVTCEECGNKVKLTLDHDPVCRSEIVEDENEDET